MATSRRAGRRHASGAPGEEPALIPKVLNIDLFHGPGKPTREARCAARCSASGKLRNAPGRLPSTPFHNSTVRRTVLRGRPARRPTRVMRVITRVGQRRRRPRKAALRVAFPVSSGRREHVPVPRHRLRAPSCRGNRKRDPTCRGIVKGGTRKPTRHVPWNCQRGYSEADPPRSAACPMRQHRAARRA